MAAPNTPFYIYKTVPDLVVIHKTQYLYINVPGILDMTSDTLITSSHISQDIWNHGTIKSSHNLRQKLNLNITYFARIESISELRELFITKVQKSELAGDRFPQGFGQSKNKTKLGQHPQHLSKTFRYDQPYRFSLLHNQRQKPKYLLKVCQVPEHQYYIKQTQKNMLLQLLE